MVRQRAGFLNRIFDITVLLILLGLVAYFSTRWISLVWLAMLLGGLYFKPDFFRQKSIVRGPGTSKFKWGVLRGWDASAWKGFYIVLAVYSLLNFLFNFHPWVLDLYTSLGFNF